MIIIIVRVLTLLEFWFVNVLCILTQALPVVSRRLASTGRRVQLNLYVSCAFVVSLAVLSNPAC